MPELTTDELNRLIHDIRFRNSDYAHEAKESLISHINTMQSQLDTSQNLIDKMMGDMAELTMKLVAMERVAVAANEYCICAGFGCDEPPFPERSDLAISLAAIALDELIATERGVGG